MNLMSQARQELVYFEDLKKNIINKIAKEWKSKEQLIHGKIQNKYYNFEYTIENCYNQTGNRTLLFLHNGNTLHDYNFNDIKYWLEKTL